MSLLKENIYRTSDGLVHFFDIGPLPGYPGLSFQLSRNYGLEEICEKLAASE